MTDLIQIAIVIFIIGSLSFIMWKGGASNPESTGRLGRRVSSLSRSLTTLDGRVRAIEDDVKELELNMATTKDIESLGKSLEERTSTLRAEMKGHHDLSERTNRAVDRIERLLIEKGLGK